jgi:bacillithiol biosynthesis cysteine-adding enzyme BshC
METDCIHFKETGYFSQIITDYLEENPKITEFYAHSPKLDAFKEAIQKRNFSSEKRSILKTALQQQYQKGKIKLSNESQLAENINALSAENTFTVTTGHQLCLFTGPLYFIYKIVSAVKLAKQLSEKYPQKQFVPVYWMASEDHDFEEISFFHFKGQKLQWKTEQSGAVGRMKTEELKAVLDQFDELLTPYTSNGSQLKSLFEKAYLKHENLADATRFIVHELFSAYGVVVVDGDDTDLKKLFVPIAKEDLLHEVSSTEVEKQSEKLSEHYKLQVNPREINLFYLTDDSRKRIVKQKDKYFIHDTELHFSEEELMDELHEHPERFSPNVLLRPVYQEVILPNLAYIGGGGELAYWFQLKTTFEHFRVPMPTLFLRNSVLWMDEKERKYFEQLEISTKQLFLDEGLLVKEWVKANAKEDLELQSEIKEFQELYADLAAKAKRMDPSLEPHTKALAEKQKQSLEQLSEKMIRAERRKQKEATARIQHLKSNLFPNRGLQERTENFSSFYLAYGEKFIQTLMEELNLPTTEFTLIKDQ